MPKYCVDEIDGEIITATHVVNAPTPIKAAHEATERQVTLRNQEVAWIRVVCEKRGHIFEYAFIP